jgi:hypothetical protein
MSLENPTARATCDAQARKRLDYHQLNDGSNNEANITNQMKQTSIVSIK